MLMLLAANAALAIILAGLGAFLFGATSSQGWRLALAAQDPYLLLLVVAAPLFLPLVVSFLLAFRMTFRIAGPIHRHVTVYEGIANGSLPRGIRTRKGDELGELTAAADQALRRLHEHLATIQENQRHLTSLAEESNLSQDVREALSKLERSIHQMNLEGAPHVRTGQPEQALNAS